LIYVSLRKFKYSHHIDEELRASSYFQAKKIDRERARQGELSIKNDAQSDRISELALSAIWEKWDSVSDFDCYFRR